MVVVVAWKADSRGADLQGADSRGAVLQGEVFPGAGHREATLRAGDHPAADSHAVGLIPRKSSAAWTATVTE